MRKKMNDKQKLMAYVLNTDVDLNRNKNITQAEIANIFRVSQPTVAQGIKEAKYRVAINELQQELSYVKNEIMQMDEAKTLELPSKVDSQYKRKP